MSYGFRAASSHEVLKGVDMNRSLSSLQRRVLGIAEQEYKNRYSRTDDVDSASVNSSLNTQELYALLESLRKLPPVLKGQLTTVFGEMEGLIVDDSDIAPFGADERRDAYVFLLDISATTIPD